MPSGRAREPLLHPVEADALERAATRAYDRLIRSQWKSRTIPILCRSRYQSLGHRKRHYSSRCGALLSRCYPLCIVEHQCADAAIEVTCHSLAEPSPRPRIVIFPVTTSVGQRIDVKPLATATLWAPFSE